MSRPPDYVPITAAIVANIALLAVRGYFIHATSSSGVDAFELFYRRLNLSGEHLLAGVNMIGFGLNLAGGIWAAVYRIPSATTHFLFTVLWGLILLLSHAQLGLYDIGLL